MNRTIELIWAFTLGMIVIGLLMTFTRNPCAKTQTSMIEIGGVKKDFLICTDGFPRIIKSY